MVGLTHPSTIALSQSDKTSFDEQGFLIVKNPAVAALKESMRESLKRIALKIIDQFEETRDHRDELAASSFGDLIDWCVANERDRRVSRAFYEIFPYLPEVISLVGHPVLSDVAHQVGLSDLIPSTLPWIRIDRPEDTKFSLPAHQDYWFSMLSPNSVVIWMPLIDLLPDMGLLQGIAGSHKNGLAPFREQESNIPFVPVEEFAESDYVELPVAADELLVFHQCLIHRSGYNGSQKTRVSIQFRFNDFDTLNELTSSFTPQHSGYVLEKHQELLRSMSKP